MNKLTSLINLNRLFAGKVIIAAGIVLTLSACLKNDDDDFVPQQVAAVSVFHASPGTPAFDFVTDKQVKTGPFIFGSWTVYNLFSTGKRSIGIFKANTTDSIKTTSITLEADKYYSLFVVDAAPNPNFLLIKDTLSAPATGKARIRFINLSPDAGNLSLTTGTDSLLFAATAYKAKTAFADVSGNRTYTLKVKNNTTDKATKGNVELKAGRIYTVWARGLDNTTNDSLKTSLQVSEHLNNF